jgi:hypothetical protein
MSVSFHPETERYKYWKESEDLELERLASHGKFSYKTIAQKLNRTAFSCQSRATVLGIHNKYLSGKKYTVDENFWSVPNPINCYWAGFSSADANIDIRKGCAYRLEISSKDFSHLQRLKSDCKFSGPILKYLPRKGGHGSVKLQVNAQSWIKDLQKNFNVVTNKTKRLSPPNVYDDYLLFCWLIGYTDGDGCICLSNRRRLSISYTSSSFVIIEWIKSFVDKHFSQKLKNKANHITTSQKYHSFVISGIRAAVIIDYLGQYPVPKLARKWSNPKILQFINTYKLKYPSFFDLKKTLPQLS